MEIPRLILALGLPWIGSYAWLRAVEARSTSHTPHRMRQLGFAFFLGLMIVYGLISAQSRLAGAVTFWPIIAVLLCYALSGLAMLRASKCAGFPGRGSETGLQRALFILFVAWAILHLTLAAVEIWHRPVYPWDAWQTWMYRAKAWFLTAQIFPLDSPAAWEQGLATSSHSMYGAGYPAFVSAVALWTATALGEWYEPLVNLPTLCCGFALTMGLYGLCREAGLPPWVSALGAYLLVSIPLIGSHLALAGQADLWQAGFTGLGLTALLMGIVKDNGFFRILGLATLFLGLLVKNEGIVWFLASLVVLAISTRPRFAAMSTLILAALVALAWLCGIHYLDIPGMGRLGVAEGYIHLPFIGQFQLISFDLWEDYRANFFGSSTWHLLWPLMVICTLGLPLLPRGPVRHASVTLLLVLAATQVFIFMFTGQGRWAEDWTAINRLPLHSVPALIVVLLLCAQRFYAARTGLESKHRWWLVPAMGMAICVSAAGVYLMSRYPSTTGSPIVLTAKDLGIVAGGGRIEGGAGIIDRFDGNIAVLSNRGLHIDTASLKMLRVHTSGENQAERRFFWRNGPRDEDLHSVGVGEGGQRILHLGDAEHWQHTAGEVGLLFFEDGGRAAKFDSLSLYPRSLSGLLALTWQDWTTTTHWSQKSVNYLPAGTESAPVKLPWFLTGWLVATCALMLLLRRTGLAPPSALFFCAIAAWVALDARWTTELWHQAVRTHHYYAASNRDHLDVAGDIELRELAGAVEDALIESDKPLLIVGETDDLDFEALRLKYHLLPIAAHYRNGSSLEDGSGVAADNILVVRSSYLAPGQQRISAADIAGTASDKFSAAYKVAVDDERGVLLTVEVD